MSAHNAAQELHDDHLMLADPGAGGTITVDRNLAYVGIISAAAEARTLAAPTRRGVLCTVVMKTDGGDVTLTVTGGYNPAGDTVLTFSAANQMALFVSVEAGDTFRWELVKATATPTNSPVAGAGITGGSGTIYESSVTEDGGIVTTRILIDLTGLGTSTTDLDIIGVGASVAHIGQITTARSGIIDAIRMTCLETPATGADDIDLYSAAEGTGVFDGAIGSLTETALITSGAAWTNGRVLGSTAVPAAGEYLYLVNGEAAVVGTYTAGKFLIELFGHR